MNEKSELPSKLYLKLGRTTQWLDELTVDPRCDDFSSREVARAVRILVNTLVGRRPRRDQQLDELLASHESTELTESTDGHACNSGDAPPDLAKLLNQAFVRLGSESISLQNCGKERDAAVRQGMAIALKAVSSLLAGGIDESAAAIALEFWAGVRNPGTATVNESAAYFWNQLSNTGDGETPFQEEV